MYFLCGMMKKAEKERSLQRCYFAVTLFFDTLQAGIQTDKIL